MQPVIVTSCDCHFDFNKYIIIIIIIIIIIKTRNDNMDRRRITVMAVQCPKACIRHLLFYRAMLCIARTMPSQDLSVCPSQAGILSIWLNISSNCFSPSGSHTIVVFPYPSVCQYSDGDPPNRGRQMQGGMKKSRFLTNISLYLRNDTR